MKNIINPPKMVWIADKINYLSNLKPGQIVTVRNPNDGSKHKVIFRRLRRGGKMFEGTFKSDNQTYSIYTEFLVMKK